MNHPTHQHHTDRRAFIKNGALILASAASTTTALANSLASADKYQPALKVGLITDLHYADKSPAGSRHYRETLSKLEEASLQFEKDKPEFVVELGDLIDAADSVDVELRYLNTINRKFAAIGKERHYVLGNHCVDTLTKSEFLDTVGQSSSYYSFDKHGIHFVVLDSCFRSDGQPYQRKNFKWTDANIPNEELEWLKADLQSGVSPVVVFAHQRLDVSNNHGVKNNADVRAILEASGRVAAVFQGHSHKNDLKHIGGIHYCTLVAMVEGSGKDSNGYSLMEVDRDGTIRLSGFRKQKDHKWDRNSADVIH